MSIAAASSTVSVSIFPATNYVVLSLDVLPSNSFWDKFGISFLAILCAGLIITLCNYHLLKKERRYKVADSFCVNLEELIIRYFDSDDKEQNKIIEIKFFAFLESFSRFVENDKSIADKPEVQSAWDILLDLGNQNSGEDEERMRKTLTAVATIRYVLTQ